MVLYLFLLTVACVLIYFYNLSHYRKWKKLGVPGPEPSLIFGNIRDATLRRKSFVDVYHEIYDAFKELRYVGIYILRRPAILVRDPELIKDVLVKDFPSFHDNDLEVDAKSDPIFGHNPFRLKGEQWKIMRGQHSVQFTTSRVKSMHPLLDEVGTKMLNYLDEHVNNSGRKHCMDAIELAAKLTTDNVAMCSLGLNARSFEDPKARLREAGKVIYEPDFANRLKLYLLFILPSAARFLKIRIMPTWGYEMFRNLVSDTLKYRKDNGIVRNDFLDSLKERRAVEEITDQVGGFFIDGYETSSFVISFMLYEIALNVDVQGKLRNEIDEVLDKYNGEFAYEALQEMDYLDAVISESIRKYPPLSQLVRRCTKPFTFPPASSTSSPVTVDVGTPIVITLMGLHYDERYFPDPQKFEPERFLGQNKDRIAKYTYIPFGEGPRLCLGMRFGLLQAKVAVSKLVSKFELRLNERTTSPLKFNPEGLLLAPLGGLWLDFYKRKI